MEESSEEKSRSDPPSDPTESTPPTQSQNDAPYRYDSDPTQSSENQGKKSTDDPSRPSSSRAKSTPYPGQVSDGSYNVKPKSRNKDGPTTMSAYYKEQDAKTKLRSRRSDDPTYGLRRLNYDKHRERVRTVKPVVDSSCPFSCKNIAVSQTKFNRQLASFTQIERDNARMLHRIAVIMKGESTVSNRLRSTTKNIFPKGKQRQVGLMHVAFDNLHLLQRIKEQKPTYSRANQLKDYKRAEKDMEKLSYYPLFWKCKKPSVMDDFYDGAMENAKRNPRPKVYMDFETDQKEGRIVIELRADIVPLTAENFRCLCTGENGPSYKCTTITRIVKDILVQGGDISSKGYGMVSSFGGSFPDENFKMKHSEPGVVTMVNYGSGTNGSQFMITGKRLSSLDGSNVACGKVIEGMSIINKFFENVTSSDKPGKQIWITGCGQLDPEPEEEDELQSEPKNPSQQKANDNRPKGTPTTTAAPPTTTDTERESSAMPSEPETSKSDNSRARQQSDGEIAEE